MLLQTDTNQDWVSAMMSANNKIKAIAPPDVGKMAAMIAGANLILCEDSTSMQLAVATGTYTIALLKAQDNKELPPHNENCVAVQSSTANLSDITPETIIEKMWQE